MSSTSRAVEGLDFKALIASVIELDGSMRWREAAAAALATETASSESKVGATLERIKDASSVLGISRRSAHAVSAALVVQDEAYSG